MVSLRPAASAARLLRSGGSRACVAAAPRRFESSSSSSELTTTKKTLPSVAPPASRGPHEPDYGAHTDRATSTFTPVPKRVLDGSEEGNMLPAAVLSGAPVELQARMVRIYKPAKPATQSGTWIGTRWRMDWDVLGKGHRWENELIGWQSSGDFMQGTHMHFKSKEDAIAFAEKQGYEYFVQEPNARKFVPKAYANNFLYSPTKLKIIRTK